MQTTQLYSEILSNASIDATELLHIVKVINPEGGSLYLPMKIPYKVDGSQEQWGPITPTTGLPTQYPLLV